MKKSLLLLAALLLFNCLTNVGLAQDPIKEIEGLAMEDGLFDAVDENRVLVLTSNEDAKAHLSEENLEKLMKAVDFETQRVVVFAWRGSGRDRVSYEVAESWPEQIFFQFQRGLTRDLRPHQKVFALRSNIACSVAGNAIDLNRAAAKKEFIHVEMKGQLEVKDSIYKLAANGVSLTLVFKDDVELKEAADNLNGESVVVTGDLEPVASEPNTKIWQIAVETLKPAK